MALAAVARESTERRLGLVGAQFGAKAALGQQKIIFSGCTIWGKGGTGPAEDYIFLFSSVAMAMKSINFLRDFLCLTLS